MTPGQHTLREILSQPDVWAEALSAFDAGRGRLLALLSSSDFDQIIVSGCGSTYYLALTAARLLRNSGLDAFACPASELLLHPGAILLPRRRYMLLTISRSGTTSETVRAQQNFKAHVRGPIVTVTCDSGSPLAQAADIAIAIDGAQEQSVAQTRSFSSMLVVAQQLAAAVAGHDLSGSRKLPAICRDLLDSQAELAQSLGTSSAIAKFFFLGSGALYGIACEAMLKMKEMSLSYSEAYHTLEFRHGPMSMASDDSLVIGLISPDAARHEVRVLDEMAGMGASTLTIGQAPGPRRPAITLAADLPPWSAPVLHLPALQLLAYYRAILNGCDPDNPQNLSAVISLDDI